MTGLQTKKEQQNKADSLANLKKPDCDYNTQRKNLILSEYGRNIQNMVDYVLTLTDKAERNKYAEAIIYYMGEMNPALRDVTDFKHKLWDHLFMISDFKLDVDSPFPIAPKASLRLPIKPMDYPTSRIKAKHYGKTAQMMIEKAMKMEPSDKKQAYVLAVANFMRSAYILWNTEAVTDEMITADLFRLSQGLIDIRDAELSKIDPKAPTRQTAIIKELNKKDANGKKSGAKTPPRGFAAKPGSSTRYNSKFTSGKGQPLAKSGKIR